MECTYTHTFNGVPNNHNNLNNQASISSVPLFANHLGQWTVARSLSLELRSGGSSGGCVRGGDTSRSASPLQLPPHSARKTVEVSYNVPRDQKTVATNVEEVEQVPHDALRGLSALPRRDAVSATGAA